MIELVQASTGDQLDNVRDLMRAFVNWHRERHQEDLALIDEYFDNREFEDELASLPGKYAPPGGRLLLALYDGKPAGCVAFKEIDKESCEMKRMFVYNEFRGKGIGKALTEKLLYEAREAGYTKMMLDTSFRQKEAQALYARMGFRKIEPYYELPKRLQDWLVFMELEL